MRLTKTMRENILRMATANVPVIDYKAKLLPVVQKVIYRHMPAPVRDVYNDEDSRPYLSTVSVFIKNGNSTGNALSLGRHYDSALIYGIRMSERDRDITVNLDPRVMEHIKANALPVEIAKAVIRCGYFEKHFEQQRLMVDVKKRLKATLDSVTTVKRLYDVLEPELHQFIPKEEVGVATANLPMTAGPVVDDLRKMGAQLPEVPKVKK